MRPIDADALKNDMQEYFDGIPVYMPGVFHVIERAPTIESEVRLGQWIDKGEYAVCTECGGHSGTQYDGLEPIALMTRFCPNCGAKMYADGGIISKERLAEIMNDGRHGDCYFFDTMEGGAMNKEDVGYAPYCPYTEDNKCPSDCYTSDGTLCDFDECPYTERGKKMNDTLKYYKRITNREKLSKMALYDMLMMMNNNLNAIVEFDGLCVMDALESDALVKPSCNGNCANCIASYLNKEAQ